MKTKTEIILETAEFYNSANRAEEDMVCCYLTTDGRKCAVGRCMVNPTVGMIGTVGDIQVVEPGEQPFALPLENELLPEYRGHSVGFWADLQQFHDNPHQWSINGLSAPGKKFLNYLLDKYPH